MRGVLQARAAIGWLLALAAAVLLAASTVDGQARRAYPDVQGVVQVAP